MSQIGGELVPAERTQAPGPVRPRDRPKGSKNMPREARSVQTNAGDRHREARPKEARYVQTDAGNRHRKTKENTEKNIESQLINDENPTG